MSRRRPPRRPGPAPRRRIELPADFQVVELRVWPAREQVDYEIALCEAATIGRFTLRAAPGALFAQLGNRRLRRALFLLVTQGQVQLRAGWIDDWADEPEKGVRV